MVASLEFINNPGVGPGDPDRHRQGRAPGREHGRFRCADGGGEPWAAPRGLRQRLQGDLRQEAEADPAEPGDPGGRRAGGQGAGDGDGKEKVVRDFRFFPQLFFAPLFCIQECDADYLTILVSDNSIIVGQLGVVGVAELLEIQV
jgi:hypothetical protein